MRLLWYNYAYQERMVNFMAFYLSDENRYIVADESLNDQLIEETEEEMAMLQRQYEELLRQGKNQKAEKLLPRLAELEEILSDTYSDDSDDSDDFDHSDDTFALLKELV